ncbi:hypothetical protein [Bradyrhizobium commune]|uniref:Uncharacterized protein n=1 Tax=Bradyrhizobium commune TaxID=83627 RepID=A0A7S9GWA5_9BRAD|nr:hypothetical protein [Bradyrhizobium commune]QPF88605.1 hypothetical protein IC761_18875 [Bradyrhizobium commune]
MNDKRPDSLSYSQLAFGVMVIPASFAILYFGNTFMVEYVGRFTGSARISDFIDQHFVSANIIYFFATMLVIAPFGFLISYLEQKRREIHWSIFAGMLVFSVPYMATFAMGVVGLVGFLIAYCGPVVRDFIDHYRLGIPVVIALVIIASICSYLSYLARSFGQIGYGVVELSFGLASICFSVFTVVMAPISGNADRLTPSEIWQAVIGFLAGVYIIVRGLVNIQDGFRRGVLTPEAVGKLVRVLIQRYGRFRNRKVFGRKKEATNAIESGARAQEIASPMPPIT